MYSMLTLEIYITLLYKGEYLGFSVTESCQLLTSNDVPPYLEPDNFTATAESPHNRAW